MLGNLLNYSLNGYKYPPKSKIRFMEDGIEKIGIISDGGGYFSYQSGKKCYCGNYIENSDVLPECFINIEEDTIIELVE